MRNTTCQTTQNCLSNLVLKWWCHDNEVGSSRRHTGERGIGEKEVSWWPLEGNLQVLVVLERYVYLYC